MHKKTGVTSRKILMVAVLVTCGTPDALNTNQRLRKNITHGFTELGIRGIELGIDQVPRMLEDKNIELLLITGSIADASINLNHIVRVARLRGTLVAFWMHDDPYEFDFHWRLRDLDCHIFSNEPNCIDAYPRKCCVQPLALAASPLDLVPRQNNKSRAKRYDLGFCGVAFPQRITIMRQLKEAGFSIACWGDGWPSELNGSTNKRLGPIGLEILYSDCQFVLNLGRDINIANQHHQIAPSMPGPRTFETALHGVVQLYIGQSPRIKRFYGPKEGVLQVDSIKEVAENLNRAKADPLWLENLGKAAATHTKHHHLYRHRCHDLLAALTAKA